MAEKTKKKEPTWDEIGKAVGKKIENRKLEHKREECKHKHKSIQCNSMSAIYGLGIIGAAVYYVTIAVGFWGVVIALLKAIVWPGFLVYELLKFLGA